MPQDNAPVHRDFFFIQLADPQFGLFSVLSGADDEYIEYMRKRRLIVRPSAKTTGFSEESKLYRLAINAANRLHPDFVIVCGDMVQDSTDAAQLNEIMRISADLDDDIPIRWVPGNHDVANSLTMDSLSKYRNQFGDDNFYFDHKGTRFVVLNSNIGFYQPGPTGEWENQISFLNSALQKPGITTHTVIFTHHPLFIENRDEPDTDLVIPSERRLILLDILKKHGVWGMFSGHWHVNNYANDGDFQMVTTAAVGYPMGNDPSGLRIVKVYEDRIEHEYYGFADIPERVDL